MSILPADGVYIAATRFICSGGQFVSQSPPSMDGHVAGAGAPLIVQRGDFIISRVCVPAENLVRTGLSDEFLADKPINLLHISIDLRAHSNGSTRRENTFFARRRSNSRCVSSPAGEIGAGLGQKRRQKFSRDTRLLK